jgi:hypothetical protein
LQNWLNSPGETPPVPPLPVPVPVPPEEVPPDWVPPVVPVDVPPVPLPAGAWGWAWVVVAGADWLGVCDWSVDVVSVWSVEVVSLDVLEVPVDVWASAADPGGGVSAGSDAGTTSWLELSLPQALRPRQAAAKRTTTNVRM